MERQRRNLPDDDCVLVKIDANVLESRLEYDTNTRLVRTELTKVSAEPI